MKRLNLKQLIGLMKNGFHVEVKALLMAGLFSRHELRLDNKTIIDFSYVDSCTTRYTLPEFKRQSIIAKAAQRNNLILEQKWG